LGSSINSPAIPKRNSVDLEAAETQVKAPAGVREELHQPEGSEALESAARLLFDNLLEEGLVDAPGAGRARAEQDCPLSVVDLIEPKIIACVRSLIQDEPLLAVDAAL